MHQPLSCNGAEFAACCGCCRSSAGFWSQANCMSSTQEKRHRHSSIARQFTAQQSQSSSSSMQQLLSNRNARSSVRACRNRSSKQPSQYHMHRLV